VVALLPLSGGNLQHGRSRVSLVWSAASEEGCLGVATARRVARTRAVDDLRPPGSSPPDHAPGGLRLLRAVQCRQVIKPSFVLIGDAAHAIHPMAGQGMNLGFGDVRGLIEHLTNPSGTLRAQVRPPDWFDLRRYERSRREPVAGDATGAGRTSPGVWKHPGSTGRVARPRLVDGGRILMAPSANDRACSKLTHPQAERSAVLGRARTGQEEGMVFWF
jgi:2-polyprenyl-6-methoxyphenol hydroxylase-like FAD-dependent oxidoreductase